MTERLADIQSRIHAVRQVGSVVNAMRGMAAARAQKGRALLPAIRSYAEVCSGAIAQALTLHHAAPDPGPAGRPALIVFAAEQGFAGAFVDRGLEFAARAMGGAHVLMVGLRGAVIAKERGLAADWTIALPDRPASIVGIVAQLADALYAHLIRGGPAAVEMRFPVWVTGRGVEFQARSLLPLDTTRFPPPRGLPPLTTLAGPVLLARLAEEYVFAQICEAAMEAYAAENQARAEAMAAAKSHIDGALEGLAQREHAVRQEEITAEVIELAAAAQAGRQR